MSGITNSLKGGVDRAVGYSASLDERAENAGTGLLNRLGDTVFGKTAESETNDAPVDAPDASITPVTQGRRSTRPDGQDPFRNAAANAAPNAAAKAAPSAATNVTPNAAPAPAKKP